MVTNPFVMQIVGTLVRFLLAGAAAWVVQHGIFTEAEVGRLMEGLTVASVAIGWSLYQKYRGRQKLMTALAAPAGITEIDLERHIERAKAIGTPLPSVTTPKDEPPTAA